MKLSEIKHGVGPIILDSPLECRYFCSVSHYMSKLALRTAVISVALAICLSIGGQAIAGDSSEGTMSSIDSEYVRPPAVAGSFYPGSPVELAKILAKYFHDAPKPNLAGKPLAIIAPHAGYVYSGEIAAKGYKILVGEDYSTVVVISPSHTTYFKGVSVFGGKAYSTPLGNIPVDRELTEKIVASGGPVALSDRGHYKGAGQSEHALEVQLPFLQVALGKFSLVAIVMGDQDLQTCTALGNAIGNAIGNRRDVLIVASSDLSHFHNQATASRLDSVVARDIKGYDVAQLFEDLDNQKAEACGGGPIITAMIAARELGASQATVTGQGDSGDAAGDKSSVVGYLSAVITSGGGEKIYDIGEDTGEEQKSDTIQQKPPGSGAEFGLSSEDKSMLLYIARDAIKSRLEGKEIYFPEKMSDALSLPLGAFVTLKKGDELRGCIGTFRSSEPLYHVVAEMARQAAFSDFRFDPVVKSEINAIDIEISVLTPMKRIYDTDSVEVGRDGLYIRRGNNSGVLLPQVPVEQGWDRTTFLDHTCLKAGLPSSSWKDERTELYIFQAEIFSER